MGAPFPSLSFCWLGLKPGPVLPKAVYRAHTLLLSGCGRSLRTWKLSQSCWGLKMAKTTGSCNFPVFSRVLFQAKHLTGDRIVLYNKCGHDEPQLGSNAPCAPDIPGFGAAEGHCWQTWGTGDQNRPKPVLVKISWSWRLFQAKKGTLIEVYRECGHNKSHGGTKVERENWMGIFAMAYFAPQISATWAYHTRNCLGMVGHP